MKYAVIESGGKQYIVSAGKKITVDKLDQKVGDKINFEKILMLRQEENILIGTPYLDGLKVSGKIVKQYRGDKLDVMRFKAKVRYRKKIGFRPELTDILVEDISQSPKTKVAKAKS